MNFPKTWLAAGCWCLGAAAGLSQTRYWNDHTMLLPWRLPLVAKTSAVRYQDLDNDGRPDVIRTFILDSIPIMWIDDDGDMQYGDTEGDTDNDCLLVDLNRDGVFGGIGDLSIDWVDIDNNGIADIQFVVQNGIREELVSFDDTSDFIALFDWNENDGIHNFIDWNQLVVQCWQHSGHCNFFEDYHGNTLLLKMHSPSYRIDDTRYNWENPFAFYDFDGDQLTEMAIRMVDMPYLRHAWRNWPTNRLTKSFDNEPDSIEVSFSHIINWVSMAWDLDNDNGQGNEMDFDMTLYLAGEGFSYEDQVHQINNLRGLPAADSLLMDSRWRQRSELVYPHQDKAYSLTWERGKWNVCRFVFDEDDDCNRWERVELYQPLDLFKTGKGGMDNNQQSDAIGDRGEFDEDFSGGGNLYISPVDGRIHLYGAEWGGWRIDQRAAYFQGYGGIYPPSTTKGRLHPSPEKWASVRYSDTDGNGFFDAIEYDLDGDITFETKVSLADLELDDRAELFNPKGKRYNDFTQLFSEAANICWKRAQDALQIAAWLGVNTSWYAFYKQPRTMFEKYAYGYWLAFYVYNDLRQWAQEGQQHSLSEALQKWYYSGTTDHLKFHMHGKKVPSTD